MSKELQHEIDSLVAEAVDGYIRDAVSKIDESLIKDEDDYREAMHEIEYCLKRDMDSIVREAAREAEARLQLD